MVQLRASLSKDFNKKYQLFFPIITFTLGTMKKTAVEKIEEIKNNLPKNWSNSAHLLSTEEVGIYFDERGIKVKDVTEKLVIAIKK